MSSEAHDLNWCQRRWSPWIPLADIRDNREILPQGSGIYRIRACGRDALMYLGQSGRLRGRLLYDLYRPLYAHTAPWNDPHTAAPALWAYRVEDGFSYEVSVTEAPEDKRERHGLEDYLLWQHRLSTGRSAMCNYGRFHSRYVRPSNRKSGRAMSRIAPEADAKLYDESADPLDLRGHPGSARWMGLTWTRPRPLTRSGISKLSPDAGVYRIYTTDGEDDAANTREKQTSLLHYIGQASDLRKRARTHVQRTWSPSAVISVAIHAAYQTYQLLERESDLLGAHVAQMGQPPLRQYGNLPPTS